MEKGLVSVIIPTYKREPDMLKRALDSVKAQTYKQLEVIVVDDSPSDYEKRADIKKLCEDYDGLKIHYIQHEKSKGGSGARNSGIRASKGEFLAFLDDDDEWLPTKTEKQVALMSDLKVGIVYCRECIVDEQTKEEKIVPRNYKRGWVFKYLITDNFIGGNSFVLIRREAIEKCGDYADVKSAQDAELFMRISKKYKVDYVDEVLLNYYVSHGDRITLNPNNKIHGFEYIDCEYKTYLLFHPIKKAIRLKKLLPYYKITNVNKYLRTLWKIIFLTPYKLKENIDLLRKIKYTVQDIRKEKNR